MKSKSMKYISSNADYIKTKQLLFGKYTKSLRMLGFDAWCFLMLFAKEEGYSNFQEMGGWHIEKRQHSNCYNMCIRGKWIVMIKP